MVDQIITDAKLLLHNDDEVKDVRLTVVREASGKVSFSTADFVLITEIEGIQVLFKPSEHSVSSINWTRGVTND